MENIEKKEFKVQLNVPAAYFTVFYTVYFIIQFIAQNFQNAIVIFALGLIMIGYLYGYRPYKYIITRKNLEVCRRIGKNKEINIMDCETICDPLPKMTKIITNAHSYEIYMTGKKRIVVSPKDQMGFVEAVIHANKRIHCQVKAYNESHRKVEKKRKRELRREEKANMDA